MSGKKRTVYRCQVCGGEMIWEIPPLGKRLEWHHWYPWASNITEDCRQGINKWDGTDGRLPIGTLEDRP